MDFLFFDLRKAFDYAQAIISDNKRLLRLTFLSIIPLAHRERERSKEIRRERESVRGRERERQTDR